MSHDAGLLTVPDDVVADDVAADVFLCPAGAVQGAEDDLAFPLGAALEAGSRPFVLTGADFLAKADANTFGIAFIEVPCNEV